MSRKPQWEEIDDKIMESDLFDDAEKEALINFLAKNNVNTYTQLKKLVPKIPGKLWSDEMRDFFTLFFKPSEMGIKNKRAEKPDSELTEKQIESRNKREQEIQNYREKLGYL